MRVEGVGEEIGRLRIYLTHAISHSAYFMLCVGWMEMSQRELATELPHCNFLSTSKWLQGASHCWWDSQL